MYRSLRAWTKVLKTAGSISAMRWWRCPKTSSLLTTLQQLLKTLVIIKIHYAYTLSIIIISHQNGGQTQVHCTQIQKYCARSVRFNTQQGWNNERQECNHRYQANVTHKKRDFTQQTKDITQIYWNGSRNKNSAKKKKGGGTWVSNSKQEHSYIVSSFPSFG